MSCEDLQLEDIVLLQLFKDQIMHNSIDQIKASTDRFSAVQTDFSDLEKALSDIKPNFPQAHTKPVWQEHLQMGPPVGCAEQFSQEPANTGGQSALKAEVSPTRDLPAQGTLPKGTTNQINKDEKRRRLGKDERLAKDAGITFNVKQTLIGLPMDEFNDLLSKNDLSEEQLNICRDIRRRGKNKVAAQNCRQKKIEQIEELHGKLSKAMARRDRVRYEHQRLASVHAAEAEKLASLTDLVLKHHGRDSQSNFTLQVVGETVTVLPKTEVKEEESSSEEIERYSNDGMTSYQPNYNNINPTFQGNSQMYPRKLFNYYQNM